MPLYEYHCPACDLTFEVLAAVSEAAKKKPCPECGRRVPRIISTFAIAAGGNGQHAEETAPIPPQSRDPRPLCVQYPHIPLSCHMDEPSLRRAVAYTQGRGHEYDDKTAKQAELRKQRGIPDPVVAPPAHDHGRNLRRHAVSHQEHGHSHQHEHSHGYGHHHSKRKAHTHSHGMRTH